MKTCELCHEDRIDGADYCYKDGSKLQEPKKCDCGTTLWEHHKYCEKCGKPNDKS